MDKKKLLALLAKKNERKQEIITQSETCEDVEELRKLSDELDGVNEEIRSLQEMIAAIPDEGQEDRSNPAGLDENGQAFRTRVVNGEIPGIVVSNAASEQRSAEKAEQKNTKDKYSTLEYRTAFMNYVQHGVMTPELRADEYTSTTDATAVIPTTIVKEIIKTLKQYGQLYSRVRKLNIKGGVKVPISSVSPTATWITEGNVSEKKKANMSGAVTFSYYGLECKIAASLLAEETTLDVFEANVIELITEAMMKALDVGIVSGDGSGEMTGITVAPGITVVTLSSSDFEDWSAWKKKVFAKLGIRYKAGAVFMMANGTFEGYIDGMTDANGQPIGRVNYGITEGAQERFGGKEVLLVEDDVIANYDDAATDEVVTVFGNLSKYAVNSNMQMTMYRYLDHDTNQWIDKAILIVDGKVLDSNAFIVVKKGV